MIPEHYAYLAAGYLIFIAGFVCGVTYDARRKGLTWWRNRAIIYSVAKRSIKKFLGQPQ